MLKRFYFSDGSGFVLVGIACDIRRMYRRMINKVDYTGLYPMYTNFPKFNNNLFYGIVVEDKKFSVVSQKIIIDWLIDDIICSWMT